MEQAPRLARALADGLGVTTGELRKMAESGALTTDVVIQSLQSQGQALEAEFGKLPLTVGRFSFDLDDVKQIEVAKGAGSSLHGSDAIGGTIVISTKQPEDYLQGQDAYLGSKVLHDGNSDKQKLSATGAARIRDTEHLLRLSGWQGHETANYDESRIPADLDGLSASTSSRIQLNEHHLLRLELDYFEDNAERNQGPREVPQPDGKWQVRQYHEQGSQRTQGGKLAWEASNLDTVLADSLTWSAYGNHSKNTANKRSLLQNDLLSGYPRYRSERELATFTEDRIGTELDVRRDLATGHLAHQLSYGIELERTTHERPVEKLSLEAGIPQPGQSAPFSRARTDRAGVWLGDVASLGQWQFTPTLRMDHQWLTPLDGSNDSNHSWHLSPSLATSYRFNDQWRLAGELLFGPAVLLAQQRQEGGILAAVVTPATIGIETGYLPLHQLRALGDEGRGLQGCLRQGGGGGQRGQQAG